MGNNSLFMEYPNIHIYNKDKLNYFPYQRRTIPFVSSPDILTPSVQVLPTKSLQSTSKNKFKKNLNDINFISNKSKSLNTINYSNLNTVYSLSSEGNRESDNKMKTPTSIIPNFNLDNFNHNNSIVSPTYASPVYYTSPMPITSTTHATASMNMNRNSISNNATSILNSCYFNEDEQYLVNDSNTITYIVNSNLGHNEKSVNTPNKSASLINKISTSTNSSNMNNLSSNNTQVKSLLPIEYYTNNFNHGNILMNSNEMVSTNNINPNSNTINDTQIISSAAILSKNNNSPHVLPIGNITKSNYTIEQEKIRRPMMYSTTTNSANVMNISPVVSNIVTGNSASTTTDTNNIQNSGNSSASSTSSTTSSSTISTLSSASSPNSNHILKDSRLTCSPESTHFHDAMNKKSKSQKKKSSTNLCDKSGIIGFAAEILTSVLPTSSNNLKHPKTRYLPELYPFIKKIARKCKIDIRTFLYALVYSQRFGEALLSNHKEAVGEYGTNHRIFLASILLAYQYQINHGMKVNFKLDAKKLSKYTDGVWTEREVEMMCKALLSTKNFILDIDDNVVKEFVETHKTDLCWYS